ncbi:MAG: YeeE/YedE family protein [Chitinophagaceae bacterium]|nr:YeeE/YedE family protein [Chitinophagaceae bacterium]
MTEFLARPWPWYIAGPLIGLTVPALLILGNKHFGISANLRHACAACFPANIPFFKYDYKKEIWNLFFVAGIFLGGVITAWLLSDPGPVVVDPRLVKELQGYGINDYSNMVPVQLYSWENLLSVKGVIMLIGGGFLVGFGSRYAGGCTSGHAIMGLSTLQWPSLLATLCFMTGGFIMANLILPFILS